MMGADSMVERFAYKRIIDVFLMLTFYDCRNGHQPTKQYIDHLEVKIGFDAALQAHPSIVVK